MGQYVTGYGLMVMSGSGIGMGVCVVGVWVCGGCVMLSGVEVHAIGVVCY